MVQPLDLHLVNVGSIPTGPTHGEGRLQPRPGDVLKSTPDCPEEPQIRLESGEEAERSPNLGLADSIQPASHPRAPTIEVVV